MHTLRFTSRCGLLGMITMMMFWIQGPEPAQAGAFKIAVLPDTQNYTASDTANAYFIDQTEWIRDNRDAQVIKFVVHEGDITNNNAAAQWARAQLAMRKLDGLVPYTLAPGNHDLGSNGGAADRSTLLNTYFPRSYYANDPARFPTYGGVYTGESTSYCNNWHTFNAGGVDWLVLALEFGPRTPVLTWADGVVSSHPNHRVIVVTHACMFNDETRHNTGHSWNPHNYGLASLPGGVNDGEEMWRNFIKRRPNMTLVLNGHVLNDGQGQRVTIGDNGNKVYQMLCNYQMIANGGDGYLRLLEIDPDARAIRATSYSPTRNQFKTDWQNDFEFTNVDLGTPPGPSTPTYLMRDDFNDGNITGWTVVNQGTIDAPSHWWVQRGEVVQDSNIYGPDVPAVANRKGTFAYYANGMGWTNYSYSVILRSTDDDGIGVMFRYQNANNYYKLDLDKQRNFRKLFKVVNGTETTLRTATGAGFTQGANSNIEIKVIGNQIQVFQDEVNVFGTVTDSSLASGTVALYSWGNTGAYFDDVAVKP